MSLEILTQPAQFNSTVSVLSSVQVATIELTHARAETLYNPATATGAFLLLSVNGVNKAIQLWDYVPQVLAIRFTNTSGDGDWSNPLNWTDAEGRSPATILPLGDFNVQIFENITQNTGNFAQSHSYSFYDNAKNFITLFAFSSFTFYNNSSNIGTLQGNVTFLDNSSNADFFGTLGTITGNANFYNNSTNSGIVQGNADVWYPVPSPLGGIVQGTLTYHGYPVRFTNAAGDGDWSNLANWTDDIGAPVTYLPTSGIDVKIYDKITKVSQGEAIAHNASFFENSSLEQITLNVSNSAIFHGTTYNFGNIKGNALFLDSSTNGSLTEYPYHTVLMMNFGGTNGSQVFPDASIYNQTITFSGQPYISTDHGLYNVSTDSGYSPPSLYLDGSSWLNANTIATTDITLGTDDFTVEVWVYPVAFASTSGYTGLYSNRIVAGGTPSTSFDFGIQNNSGYLYFYDANTNSTSYGSIAVASNVWTHLALVRQNGTITFYVNGVANGAFANTSDLGNFQNSYIGTDTNGSTDTYNGWIEDLRVVNGKALYTANFLTPTVMLVPVDGLDPVIFGNVGFNNNSLNVGSVSGNAIFSNLAVNGEVPSTNGETVDLLMHFDGNFNDSSTFNRQFNTNGAVIASSQAKFGSGSLNVNGGNGLTIGSDPTLGFAGDFTIECWLWLNNTGGYQWFMNTTQNSEDASGWLFYVETNGYIQFLCHSANNPGGSSWDLGLNNGQGVPYTNQWFHVAVTRQNGNLQMFINGQNTGASTFGDTTQPIYWGDTFQIGNYYGNSNIALDGYIDEIRIINGYAAYTSNFTPPTAPFTLPPSPVSKTGSVLGTATFNDSTQNLNGVVFDAEFNGSSINSSVVSNSAIFAGTSLNVGSVSGNAVFHDTATNGQFIDTLLLMHFDDSYGSQNFVDSSNHNTSFSWNGYPYIDNGQSKFGGSSIYFDGNSSEIYPANNAGNNFNFGTGDFTIEFWLQLATYNCSNLVIFDTRDWSNQNSFCIYLRPCNPWQITFNTWQQGDVIVGSNNGIYPYDGWHHVAVSRQNGTSYLFVDGNLQGTYNDGNTYQSIPYRPIIGNSFDNHPFQGWMDELRIIKGKAIYTQNFTPPSAPLSIAQGTPGNIAGNASFYGTSQNASGILYTADFHDYSFNNSDIYQGTFYDQSYNNTSGELLSASFLDSSINYGGILDIGTIQAQSHNYGYISHANVYYPAHYPLEGTWGNVTYYGYSFGCTNRVADNYNPNANIDDGSCTYTLTGRISAYWNMDETSGTRSDATGHGLTLFDPTSSVTSDTGIINNAAVFNGTNFLQTE